MSDWKEIKKPDGTVDYFFNIKTGITTSERPFELGGLPKSSNTNSSKI